MNRVMIILVLAAILAAGCKKSDSGTGSSTEVPSGNNYFPFEVGRSWTYNTTGTLPNGQLDPRATHTLVARVFQMNQTIAGQPNATIIQATDEKNHTNNLIVHASPTVFSAYMASSALPGSSLSWAYFYPGSQWSITLGLNDIQKVYFYGQSGLTIDIRRLPNTTIARATVLGVDTVRIEGVSIGLTTLAVGRTGYADTMTIVINVVNKVRGYGPAFTSWMPIWAASLSTIDRNLFSWDSTFAFKRHNGTTIRNHIVYSVTSKFVQNETVSAAGGSVNAEKHTFLVTVTEAIDSIAGGSTYTIFNGISFQLVGTLWMASGIGFVKGEVSGSAITRNFEVGISGSVDSQGYFSGYFMSPRMSYYYYDDYGYAGFEYFNVLTQLPPPTGANSFVLAAKNF